MTIKPLIVILTMLFVGLQYKLWFEQGGISEVWRLKHEISIHLADNAQLMQRNTALMAEIEDLKSGQIAIEEHARNDLGMVKPGEVFYQVISK